MTQEVLNTKEAFYSNQRQIGVSCLSKNYDIDKVTNNLELYVGNYVQKGIFHYTEDNFCTEQIIKKYENYLGIN